MDTPELHRAHTNIDPEIILLHTALFKHVKPSEVDQLIPHLHQWVFNKGDFIFREGATDNRMFILENGRVKLIRESHDGRIQLLSIHGPGEVLGEIPVFDPLGGPRTASAVAMQDNTAGVSLSHESLLKWLNDHPSVAVSMLQVLARRMRRNNERISDEPTEKGLLVPHDLTQGELAQLVGTSRETVNKALMDFTNRGWIARDGRAIIIYSPGKLIWRSQH